MQNLLAMTDGTGYVHFLFLQPFNAARVGLTNLV
jgi:hypothetical protein